MQKFFQGGANLGYGQKGGGGGGAEAYVRCYTLHLLGEARMTQGVANAPPPLNTALIAVVLILGLFPGTPLSPEEIHFSMVRGRNGSLQNSMDDRYSYQAN